MNFSLILCPTLTLGTLFKTFKYIFFKCLKYIICMYLLRDCYNRKKKLETKYGARLCCV